MGRIVDVLPFLEKFPFKTLSKINGEWLFKVEDPLADWNRHTYRLTFCDGKITIALTDKEADSVINIPTLTTMFLGYKRPTYLQKIGRLQASPEHVQLLESIIPTDVPYYSDYF